MKYIIESITCALAYGYWESHIVQEAISDLVFGGGTWVIRTNAPIKAIFEMFAGGFLKTRGIFKGVYFVDGVGILCDEFVPSR